MSSESAPSIMQYAIDFFAATSSSFLASPLITAVDKALVENASGRAKLIPSFTDSLKDVIRRPKTFFTSKAFLWVWGIYAGTYLTANMSRTFTARNKIEPSKGEFATWLSTTAANSTICITKDRVFAKEFRAIGAPAVSAGWKPTSIWLLRDAIAIYFCVTLPPITAKYLTSVFGEQHQDSCATIAQFAVPLLFCFLLAPIHLAGFFAYNQPNGTTAELIKFLKKDYLMNVALKMMRTLPAWGIGASLNTKILSTYKRNQSRHD